MGPAANIPTASFRLSVPTSLERPRWQSIAPPVAQIAYVHGLAIAISALIMVAVMILTGRTTTATTATPTRRGAARML